MNYFEKYNVPGPRYTSYPTVPYWDHTPTEQEWIHHLGKSLLSAQKQNLGAAIYIHIPFCQSLCTYCGCNTRITRNKGVSNPYIQSVHDEWKLYRKALHSQFPLDRKIPVSEIHLGGGTPTFLSPDELCALMNPILADIEKKEDAEFSIEVDPRVTTRAHLEVLRELGFKRLSLGVQDFDIKVQEAVNRVQSTELVQKITEEARALGFESINYDLIYGLPFQTPQSIEKTIQTVCELKPSRIAFYSYAHVPWIKPGHRRFTETDLPSGEEKRKLYEIGRSIFEPRGYREIGMDHFALEEDSLWKAVKTHSLHRNFMGYTSKLVSPLIGLGVSAISDSWTAFMQNEKVLENYQKKVAVGIIPILRGHILSEEDLILRKHILNLMTELKTEWGAQGMKASVLSTLPDRLSELQKDHLVKLSDTSCEVTEEGRAFLRNICMAFDARLLRRTPETRLFSQTV